MYGKKGKARPKGTIVKRIVEYKIPPKALLNLEIDKELKMAFLQGDLQTKTQLLQEHANDTDDRLWRSNEWMFLERALGEGTPDDIYDRSMESKQGGGLDSFGYGTTRG